MPCRCAPPVKGRLVARLGPGGFALVYSAVSAAALGWLIMAARHAPVVPLWGWAPWQRPVAQAAMLAACLLVALAAFVPNPLSFGGWRNARSDPARPGIVGLTRHPFLAALVMWAAGHGPANGDLAQVLMFAGLAGFAALGMAMINRRNRRVLGVETWHRLCPARANLPPRLALWWGTGGAPLGDRSPAVWP
jgi:uncharacterized membrane protein